MPGVGTRFRPRRRCSRPASCGSPSPSGPRGPSWSTTGPAGPWSSAGGRCCRPGWSRSVGDFDVDDAVEIAGPDGAVFAKGLVRHAAGAARRLGRAALGGAARGRAHRGRPPRRPGRAGLTVRPGTRARGGATTLTRCRRAPFPISPTSAAGPKRPADVLRRRSPGPVTRPCCARPTCSRSAPTEVLEANADDVDRGRSGRAPTPPRSTGCASTPAGWPPWPAGCARWPPCPTRWARWSTAGCGPTACGSSGSGSPSGWSGSSTRTGPT